MKIEIDEVDAAQVRAILLTHAELQDNRIMGSEVQLASVMNIKPIDREAQSDIKADIDGMSIDVQNLKRIAELFI